MEDIKEKNKVDPEVRVPKIEYHYLHNDRMSLEDVKNLAKSEKDLKDLPENYYVLYDCKDLERFFKESVESLQLHLEDSEDKAFISIISPHERTSLTDFSLDLYGKKWFIYQEPMEK